MNGGIGDGGLIVRVIEFAALCGKYEEKARMAPETASGFRRYAARTRSIYVGALNGISEATARG